MISAWTIGINLIARSNAGLVFGKMGAQAQAANAQVKGLTKSVNLSQAGIKAVGMALNVAGLAGAATMAIGIKGAADLQDAYAQTGVAMGRTSEWVKENFQTTAMAMSQATAQSVTDSMGLLRVMATSGINDPSQMKALAMPIAQFADTQYLGKNHTSFDDSTKLAVKIAHQFGARTASELKPILNSLFKISQDMPDSLKSAGTQLKYYAAKYTERGVTANEVLMLQATLDRVGYGEGKSGTGMYQIYRNLLSPNKKQAIGQHRLGIDGKDIIGGDGTFHVEALLNKLNSEYLAARAALPTNKNAVKEYDQKLNLAFTSNASLIAGVLSSIAGRSQYKNVGQTMNRVHNLQEAQIQLMSTLNSQTTVLATNFKSLAAMLAQPLIPALTKLVSNTATLVGNLANYFDKHPHQAAAVGIGLSALGIATLINFLKGDFIRHIFVHLGKSIPGGSRIGMSLSGRGMAELEKAGEFITKTLIGGITRVGGSLLQKAIGGPLGILMVISSVGDAFHALGMRAGDIGGSLRKAADWIRDTGTPLLSKAITDGFKTGIMGVVPAIINGLASAINSMMNSIDSVTNPWTFIPNIIKTFKTGKAAWDKQGAIDDQDKATHPAGYRGTTLAPKMRPMSAHGFAPIPMMSAHGQHAMVININAPFVASASTSDATNRLHAIQHGRQVTKQVAAVMSQYGRTATRAAGQTIASARMSSFETTSSYS